MKAKNAVEENDAFITLMRVVQEDPDVRKTLAGILQQPPFHRKSLLNTLIREITLKGAPADFVAAISELLNDDVAKMLAEFITELEPLDSR
jgi:hypothetical protein